MIHVLVTAIGGSGQGDQILKALRLGEPGRYRIFGADMKPGCAQASLVEEFAVLPGARDPGYLDALFALCRRWEIRALFHGSEAELKLFSEKREAIESKGMFLPINTSPIIDLCLDKARFNARLDNMGFPAPRYCVANDTAGLDEIGWFPVVVKPSTGGGGSANVYIAQSRSELTGLAGYLGLGTSTTNLLIQEYIGTPRDEYTVGILHDMNGRYIDGVAVHRDLASSISVRLAVANRTGRPELGPRLVISSGVSQGRIGKFPELVEQCREIAERLESRGPLNFQCRLVEGVVRIFEVNPRYSGTSSMRAMIGFNEPDLMIRFHLLGEEIPRDRSWPYARIERTLAEHLLPDLDP